MPLIAEFAIGYNERLEDVLDMPYNRFYVFYEYLNERAKREIEAMKRK